MDWGFDANEPDAIEETGSDRDAPREPRHSRERDVPERGSPERVVKDRSSQERGGQERRFCCPLPPCREKLRNAAHRSPTQLNFEEMARHLEIHGEVSYNRFLLKFTADGHDFTVFPDGRAIIKGTNDVDKARTLYAKYIGH